MGRRKHDLNCPYCGERAVRRTSTEVTPTYRDIYYDCPNFECRHTFKAALHYEYGLSPSHLPDAGIDLPFRPATNARIRAGPCDPPDAIEPIALTG